jgi:uncharacterized protein
VDPQAFSIDVGSAGTVSALRYRTAAPARPLLVLAHGAGAPHTSRFMADAALDLAARGIETVTFNFPYMEARRRMPDRAPVLEACFRAVLAAIASDAADARPLVVGGKSMGGRIASHLAAGPAQGHPPLAGLLCLGYPLHPPGHPERPRTSHLPAIAVPTLIVQGARDPFGTRDELAPVVATMPRATLYVVEGGDHSLTVPKRGWPVAQPRVDAAWRAAVAAWVADVVTTPGGSASRRPRRP